jgi:hypothetical protein
MALTTKLLRLDKSGIQGKTAHVGVERDDPAGFWVAEITGIPIWLNRSTAWTWIQARYTDAQLRQIGRSVNGKEKDIWMLLWKSDDLQLAIDADLIECDTDIDKINANLVLVVDATIGTMRLIVDDVLRSNKRMLQRDKRTLRNESRLIRTVERIILLMAPTGDEAG